jgi:hypothetical protein
MKRFYIAATAAAVLVGAQCMSWAALSLEGQSGIFLNGLAYTVNPGKTEVSAHDVNLSGLGSVQTYSITTGLTHGIELGYTRIGSEVSGVASQDVINAKWNFAKESKTAPAISVWTISRSLTGGSNSIDFGVSASKIIPLGKTPLVVDLGARSTRAKGLGLFGYSNDREVKLEGSAAIFLTKKFAVGTEFKEQIGGDTWKDIAFRYVASDKLNIDAGIADLGPGLRNQIALAATRVF